MRADRGLRSWGIIQIDRLTKRYGTTVALDDVSFEVRAGAVTGLLGPNGAGKSTLMRLVVALDRPTSGRVTVQGRDYAALRQPCGSWGRTWAVAPCIPTARPASISWPWPAPGGCGRMPVLDGLAVLQHLRREDNPARVLILTSFGESEYVRTAIQLAADSFLLKSDSPYDILRAVRGTAAGETWLSPAVARVVTTELGHGLARQDETRRARESLAALSPRERSIVDLLARGCTDAEIAEQLHLAESTVEANISSALTRLQLRNRVELAWLAWVADRS